MNTINPKISVIVPVYNTSTYLRRCLDSILEQDFTSYEVIWKKIRKNQSYKSSK